MDKRDYYDVLGVGREAGEDEIKRSYRKLAMQFHPDRNPDDPDAEQNFKEAAEAYEVLRDPNKRARYDQFGHAGMDANGFQGFSSSEDIFSAFSDIFSEFFGFGRTRSRGGGPRPQSGADLRYNLSIDFRAAAMGEEVTLHLPKNVDCEECGGSGAEPGTSPETCPQCGGTGQMQQSQGFFRIAVTCPSCRGQGQIIPKPCKQCRGLGVVEEVRELSVRVPAGVDNGSRLRLRGEGEPGIHGGPPGDLYVVIHVEEDEVFRRQGQDLILTREISMVQAALGDKIEVPTLGEGDDEFVTMKIPKGTQSGKVFSLRGQGLPYLGSAHKGDLLVEVIVNTPTSLSKKQEELLKEFAALEEQKTKNKVKNFFKKAGKAASG
ncbi:MAG: molecular chaperone DnaJ [Desulfovibrio sp.]|nr:MAG: molecular chaperone DnaJ [Desulfovibrio sp.]